MASGIKRNIPVPEIDRPNKQGILQIGTHKDSRGAVSSTATVMFAEPDGCMTCEIFGDFHKVLARGHKKPVTQKVIDTQHAEVFTPEAIEILKAEVILFYRQKNKKDEAA